MHNKDPNEYKYYFSDGRTLYDLFQRGLHMSENLPCMGYRPIDASTGKAGAFVWLTSTSTYLDVRRNYVGVRRRTSISVDVPRCALRTSTYVDAEGS